MEDFSQQKSAQRRENFWSRMGGKDSKQANDPFSPLYWHKKFNTWKEGGEIPIMAESPIKVQEVENNETVLLPSEKLYQFKGKTHDEGGIATNLPPESKVFSNYLKVPQTIVNLIKGDNKEYNKETKYSYADLSRKFPLQPFENALKNKDIDPYQRRSAEIQLERNKSMLNTLFAGQEYDKQLKNIKNNPTYAQVGIPIEPWKPKYLNTYLDYQESGGDDIYGRVSQSDAEEWAKRHEKSINRVMQEKFKGVPFDYKNKDHVKAWQEDYDKEYFTGTKKFDRTDGKLGEYTYDAPVKDEDKESNASKPLALLKPLTREPFVPSPPEKVDILLSKTSSPKKWKWGIDSKLAGTVLDIGMQLSDRLKVQSPVYYDNQTTPLFNRYVQFDSKDAGRNLALQAQQIQNSNLPEAVKQARLAELSANSQMIQSNVDLTNQQRYEQKLAQDTNKLQQYIDKNQLIRNQDLDNFRQRVARIQDLRNQFESNRKEKIFNSIAGYLNYVDDTLKKSELTSENYYWNPITGRRVYKGKKQDPLKEQEQKMLAFSQNVLNNAVDLQGGLKLYTMPDGSRFIIDPTSTTNRVTKIN